MASFFQKARTVVLSTAHELLDKAIDMNSVGALKQHVRDLEESLADLKEASAVASGYVVSTTRERDTLQAKIDELNSNIEFILTDSDTNNDHLAEPLAARLIGLEEQLEFKNQELSSAEVTARQLGEAVSKLRTRHQSMVSQVQRLEAMERAAKAKNSAADAMEQAGKLGSATAEVSVDNIEQRMQRSSDVADVRFQQALGELNDSVDQDVVTAKAAARLAEIRKRISSQE